MELAESAGDIDSAHDSGVTRTGSGYARLSFKT